MYLLATDFHLDDQQANKYRWVVFDQLERVCKTEDISRVFCLGDMTDKRDRFPAEMVNHLVACWQRLPPSVILRGNHDTTVSGRSFWEFLSEIDGIQYVSHPTLDSGGLLLLPFSPRPREEWKGLVTRDVSTIFLHATRSGTIAENGFALSGQDLPPIPRRVKVYSGDVHNQQTVDNWIYIGAPHPVKFGDDYPCRFLLLDEDTHDIVREIPLQPIGKRVVEISCLDDLARVEVHEGDQVRIRASVVPGSIDFGEFETGIDRWARERGVDVASIEGAYDITAQSGSVSQELQPDELLRAFAAEEDIAVDLLDVGLELLTEARG